MHTENWRVLLNQPAAGAWNMAVDESLMHYVRGTGESVLRVYGWHTPTLSFGRNQAAAGKYDPARIRAAGVACVRRPTGGRAVLHFSEVTYSVVAVESNLGSLRDSYARINALLLNAVQRLGVHATTASGERVESALSRAIAHGTSPCFDTPSKGEVVVDGRKLVGSAQWRDGNVLLQHGSILTNDDQSRIIDLLVERTAGDRFPATLTESMGREPALEEVAGALHAAVVELEDADPAPLSVQELPGEILAGAITRYSDERWTWRR